MVPTWNDLGTWSGVLGPSTQGGTLDPGLLSVLSSRYIDHGDLFEEDGRRNEKEEETGLVEKGERNS